MTTVDGDRGREVFHHRELTAAHITAIHLHKERFAALTSL